MDWPAEFRLALDIDHLAGARPHPRGQPRRTAEHVAADLKHRQGVDLAHPRAVGVDQHRAAGDRLVAELAQPPGTAFALGRHPVDIGGPDPGRLALGCPEIGLLYEIGQEPGVERQPFGITGGAQAFAHQPGHGAGL